MAMSYNNAFMHVVSTTGGVFLSDFFFFFYKNRRLNEEQGENVHRFMCINDSIVQEVLLMHTC